MEISHKLDTIYTTSFKHKIPDSDLTFIIQTLTNPPSLPIFIKKFSAADSQKLYYTTLMSTSIKIMQNVVNYDQSTLPLTLVFDILQIFYEYLFKDFSFQSSLCYVDYSRLKQTANHNILEILCILINDNIKDKMCYYLVNKDDVDMYGLNFALTLEKTKNVKNSTCKILNHKKFDVKFLEVIVNFKKLISINNLRKVFKLVAEKIVKNIQNDLNGQQELMIYFAIISEINTILNEKCLELLDCVPDVVNEAYLGFLYALMVDQECVIKVWNILNNHNILRIIIEKLNTVNNILHEENLNLYHSDIFYIKYGVSIVKKVIENVESCKHFFITHCDSFLNLLWTKLPYDTTSILFEFTSLLLFDEEIQIKVYEYFQHVQIFSRTKKEKKITKKTDESFFYNPKSLYNVFEEEMKEDNYELTEKAVFLCSRMLMYGMFEEEIFDYYKVVVRSSNHKIMLTILQRTIDKKQPITESLISNIKSGIEKNAQLCDAFLKFCIRNHSESCVKNIFKFITNNINLMYLIFSSKSDEFFSFIAHIDSREILPYVNDDFFDRVSDNPEKGLKYLISTLKNDTDFCNHMLKNVEFFNKLNGCDELKLELYNILSENNFDDFDALLEVDPESMNHFVLPKIYNNDYYYILSRIIKRKHEDGDNYKHYILTKYEYNENNLTGYCKYLKTLIICNVNTENMVKNLVDLNVESECIAELVGFIRVIKKANIVYNFTPKKLSNALLNKIGTFDNNFFIRKFDQATAYEKFMMFFILNIAEINEDVFKLIMKEITNLMNNDTFVNEHDFLLIQCLTFMIYSKNVGRIIKIFNSVDVPDKFVDILVRINVKSLINNEKEMFNMKLIRRASNDIQVKICVLAFYGKMLENDVLREMVGSLRKNVVDENLEYIYKEVERVNV